MCFPVYLSSTLREILSLFLFDDQRRARDFPASRSFGRVLRDACKKGPLTSVRRRVSRVVHLRKCSRGCVRRSSSVSSPNSRRGVRGSQVGTTALVECLRARDGRGPPSPSRTLLRTANEISRDEVRDQGGLEFARYGRERSRARLVLADDPQVESRWVQCPVGQRTREPRQAGEQLPDLSTTRTHVHVYTAAHTFPRDRTRPRAPPLRTPRANIRGVA